ncbi:terminase gpP N-terminus-related DNA-binding protein [Tenacibaculum sp. M341]|uniref:terminase gpP N-terminus-related DNA-binding protein n=1 Tax=Tenacibaculum sp. M341 TaxID=2530339 RepID=UPI0010526D28|nr:hypothetical protein [Tenacibaculum sp. M341]TCI85325.1 hypothetical protein EYW44_17275 [Tenacibaculum sp. M341]
MRLTDEKRRELLKRAKELLKKDLTYKEIANAIGINEKTASKWLKPYKETENIEKKLIQRISKALADENTSVRDIFCLFQALSVYKKY